MEGVGQFTLGQDFFVAARHLFEGTVAGALKFKHSGPIEYMYAHALELMLKGGLQVCGQSPNRTHNLRQLYDQARQNKSLSARFTAVENSVKDCWRQFLREARDAHSAQLKSLGISDADSLKEFGVFDNASIGKELPTMLGVVQWLSDRHADEGGRFRYFKGGLDRRELVQAFGLKEDVVLRTVDWGCEELSTQIENLIRLELPR